MTATPITPGRAYRVTINHQHITVLARNGAAAIAAILRSIA